MARSRELVLPQQSGRHLQEGVHAAGTQQRRVQRLRPVGRAQHEHAAAAGQAVHLGEQLVQHARGGGVARRTARAGGATAPRRDGVLQGSPWLAFNAFRSALTSIN